MKVPLVPPPTVVVPETVKVLFAAALNVVPSPIYKSPPTLTLAAVETEAVPLSVRLLKVLALDPPIVFPEPVIVTVLVEAENVLLFIQLPPTFIAGELVQV